MSQENVDEVDEDVVLNAEDIVQVIDLGENDGVASDSDDDYDGGDDENEMEVGAEGDAIKEDSALVFRGHKDSVFTVKIDPKSSSLAVTGSQDDTAIVWNISTGDTLFTCTGHTDSVTSVGFSYDSSYVATADMSGLIKVWKTETKEEIWSFEGGETEWLRWHPLANVLLVGTNDGDVWMWKIPDGDCKTFHHNSSVTSSNILSDGKRLCTGCEDGSLKFWDLKSGESIYSLSGHDSHKSSVLSIDSHSDGKLVLTGSTEQTAKLINTQTGKVITTFDCSSPTEGDNSEDENSVETVGLSNMFPYAATGCMNGIVGVWDIPSQTLRHQCKHEAGVVKLKWDNVSPMIYTACLDGVIRLWDARTSSTVSTWEGHTAEILDFDISKDGSTIVSVAEDQTARVFSVHSPDR
ncbi:hypothetical protein LOTGIDRAFT_191849 [Lottia gigantea]|uniref:Angio-associated migratory cell protein n=1 Tax=Lottia gigantea TaxID=225164 RepID=V4BP40_LOTGI|nr:hypothetical protein LOTGIDRAFT_191849 [Lottia gigantea]ESO90709.1 hypothetical protein LOTGIDRAFT_191849 [Lottia gigantea]